MLFEEIMDLIDDYAFLDKLSDFDKKEFEHQLKAILEE